MTLRRKAHKPSETGIESIIASMPMYRGARAGDPTVLRGPSYFTSSESFAKTYGSTAAFRVSLKNPLIVSNDEWHEYANTPYNPIEDVADKVRQSSHDSVVNVRETPVGKMYTVFLLNSKQAKVLR